MKGGVFSFLLGAGNYDERCVGRHEPREGCLVSTAQVYDGKRPYETAWAHPEYNDGAMVIVEAYDMREEAAAGHTRWVAAMDAPEPPESVQDCFNLHIGKMCELFGLDDGKHSRKKR